MTGNLTSGDRSHVERASDDLLLLVTKFETSGVASPDLEDVAAATLQSYTRERLPALLRRIGRNQIRARDVQAGWDEAADALTGAALSHVLLSLRLLVWSSKRAGLSAAEVIAEVRAHTDVEEV